MTRTRKFSTYGRVLAACALLLCAWAVSARDVTDLYRADVTVTDRSAGELTRGTTAALAEVLIKLTGNRHLPGDAMVKPLLAKATRLVLQYGYANAPSGGLLLTTRFDEQALGAELQSRP